MTYDSKFAGQKPIRVFLITLTLVAFGEFIFADKVAKNSLCNKVIKLPGVCVNFSDFDPDFPCNSFWSSTVNSYETSSALPSVWCNYESFDGNISEKIHDETQRNLRLLQCPPSYQFDYGRMGLVEVSPSEHIRRFFCAINFPPCVDATEDENEPMVQIFPPCQSLCREAKGQCRGNRSDKKFPACEHFARPKEVNRKCVPPAFEY